MTDTVLPYGAWPSTVSATALVEGASSPGEIHADGTDVWWSEARPAQGGRIQLVRLDAAGTPHEVLPDGWSARTRVHEYGGGAWAVHHGVAVFSAWDDQRIHRLDAGALRPVPISPEPSSRHALRYGALSVIPAGTWGERAWVLCVRESHGVDGAVVNELVALPVDGAAAADPAEVRVLASGSDFYAAPRACPGRLAWVQWEHPNMPWDATELAVAAVDVVHGVPTAGPPTVMAGAGAAGSPQSVVQPEFAADGSLLYLSDDGGWWNLYHRDVAGDVTHVAPVEAEIGGPAWVLGARWYAPLPDGRVAAVLNHQGRDSLVMIDPSQPALAPRPVQTQLSNIGDIAAAPDGSVLLVAGSGALEPAPWRVAPDGALTRLRAPRDLPLDTQDVSRPQWIAFPSAQGRTAYANLYLPRNAAARAPRGELPPLLVEIHGGPTAQTRALLDLSVQYWTSRGFAVADVDYGGSTGYGRPYRELLRGQWGVVDVQDCQAVVAYLAAQGLVDGERAAIRGGSAGGFTTLAALTGSDVFAAGASHYGVADLAALARDTHKFESRYMDSMVGPWPEAEQTYAERSPINHVDRLDVPLAVFQGLDDEVVPPAQAQLIVDAVKDKGLPYVYLSFQGEGHGFRQGANIVRALEAELWFYGKVFGFAPADEIAAPPGGGFDTRA